MAAVQGPYLWMGPQGSVTLELPPDASHSALVGVADRLCREFCGVVVERYPEQVSEDGKEYWFIEASGVRLMVMRKPPRIPVGISSSRDGVDLLIRIAKAWGVERFVGWRWPFWRMRRVLFGRGHA